MADRYVYLILPGLIGAVLLAVQHAVVSRSSRLALPRAVSSAAVWVTIGVWAVWLGFLTLSSVERVHLWRYPVLLENDAVAKHPNGLLANNKRARAAAAAGDVETALRALWMTLERGDLRYSSLLGDPAFGPIRGDQRFTSMIAEMARRRLALRSHYSNPSQVELFGFAEAAALLMQYDLAESLLEQALEVGGMSDDVVRTQLGRVRAAHRAADAAQAREREIAP
jgi:hypothetical protein